ncbi:Uncharacterised protein [Mycobacterium tuberculosis]|nr:Uncharacterised protein [Mycobacterium tuberculosis]
MAKPPIIARLLVKRINGHIANGSWKLSTTWLSTSILPTPPSPNHQTPRKAGPSASARVISRRCQHGIFMSRKPSMMIWPAMVPVKVELCPEASSAMPNSVAAKALPTTGSSRR